MPVPKFPTETLHVKIQKPKPCKRCLWLLTNKFSSTVEAKYGFVTQTGNTAEVKEFCNIPIYTKHPTVKVKKELPLHKEKAACMKTCVSTLYSVAEHSSLSRSESERFMAILKVYCKWGTPSDFAFAFSSDGIGISLRVSFCIVGKILIHRQPWDRMQIFGNKHLCSVRVWHCRKFSVLTEFDRHHSNLFAARHCDTKIN